MTSRQKKIIGVLFLILLILIGVYVGKTLMNRGSENTPTEESIARPLTDQERSELIQRLKAPRPSSSRSMTTLSNEEKAIVDVLSAATTSKPRTTSQRSYRYDPPPPLSEDSKNLIKMLTPTPAQ